MRIVRAALSVIVVLFLVLAPRPLLSALREDPMAHLFEVKQPEWHGVIELWHIADFRTYQGSVTKFLRERCDRFAAAHPGVHIEVKGLTTKMYLDRVGRGAFPDAYSFPAGFLYREQLRRLELTLPALTGNLRAAESEGSVFAAPYLISGYFLLINEQRLLESGGDPPAEATRELLQAYLSDGELSVPPVLGAYFGLSGESRDYADFQKGRVTAAVADARAYGDLLRDTDGNLLLRALPLSGYTEQVMYLGAAANTDDRRASLIAELCAYLLSDGVQQELTALGAMPVRPRLDNIVYGMDTLDAWYASYAADTVAPDAFAYQRHRDALLEDATRAMAGEAGGCEAFSERMAVVLAEGN